MIAARLAVPLGLAIASAIAAVTLAPRAFEAHSLLVIQDDPVAIADRAVGNSFDSAAAAREITSALAAGDADLAASFLELAEERRIAVSADIADKVRQAKAETVGAARSMESFALG